MNFFDLHCDTPYECYMKGQRFCENSLAVSGADGKSFKKWSQVFAVWIKDDAQEPFRLYRNIITDFKEKLSESPDNLVPFFAVEGGAVIGDNPDLLYELKNDGIKFLTLTWNGQNRIAGGCKTDGGLTKFGCGVIRILNKLKIAVDLSHLNDKSFFPAAELSELPLVTHTCCRKIFNNPRNLTDEQMKLIGERKGIIGLCFYPDFLGGEVYSRLYENICHMLDLGLEDSIAIGSDFDGAVMDKKLDNIAKIPALYAFLAKKGLNSALLEKIFYKNAENYMKPLTNTL